MAKNGGLNLVCGRCGCGYSGHGLSKWCGDCRPVVVREQRDLRRGRVVDPLVSGWSEFKASVLRGRVNKQAFKNRDLLRLGIDDYRGLVGECCYCGGPGFGLARIDNSGVWEKGNVVCVCGECGGMRRGMGHEGFLSRVCLIADRSVK